MSNTEWYCTAIRYEFFDGKRNYTVEFSPGLGKWFIFNNSERSDALKVIEVKKERVCYESAKYHLEHYLDSKAPVKSIK